MKSRAQILVLFLFFLSSWAFAKPVRCQKQAEKIAIEESEKKGNLAKGQIGIANPTEMDGEAIVVYIGAHAHYNYLRGRGVFS